jgi:hypothetical protein
MTMDQTTTGGCGCGDIRFEIAGAPVFQNHCQCLDCQKRSGTGHSSYLSFRGKASLQVTGTPSLWPVTADSGHVKTHAFCPRCGTPLYLTFASMPDLVAVHAAALDAPSVFAPQVLTYSRSGLAWDSIDPGLKAFATRPG